MTRKESKNDILQRLEADVEALATLENLKNNKDIKKKATVRFGAKIEKHVFDSKEPTISKHSKNNFESSDEEFPSAEEDVNHADEHDDLSSEFDEDFKGYDSDEQDWQQALTPEEELKLLLEPVEDEDDQGSEQEDFEDGRDYEEYEEEEEYGEEDLEGDCSDFDASEDSEDNILPSNNSKTSSSDKSLSKKNAEKEAKSKKRKLTLNLGDEDDSSSDEQNKPLSRFQREQARLRETIKAMESENVAGEKPWQLRGEVTAVDRPVNSLLEHDLQFEHAARPAPQITEEVSETVETLIRQRIRDRAWDDVERKSRSSLVAARQKRNLPEVDTEQSKLSLAEVYEKERTVVSTANDGPVGVVDEKLKGAHDEITNLFGRICRELDSLSRNKFVSRVPLLVDPLEELEARVQARKQKKTSKAN